MKTSVLIIFCRGDLYSSMADLQDCSTLTPSPVVKVRQVMNIPCSSLLSLSGKLSLERML